jgi:hypothetical protein
MACSSEGVIGVTPMLTIERPPVRDWPSAMLSKPRRCQETNNATLRPGLRHCQESPHERRRALTGKAFEVPHHMHLVVGTELVGDVRPEALLRGHFRLKRSPNRGVPVSDSEALPIVSRLIKKWRARQDSNLRPPA